MPVRDRVPVSRTYRAARKRAILSFRNFASAGLVAAPAARRIPRMSTTARWSADRSGRDDLAFAASFGPARRGHNGSAWCGAADAEPCGRNRPDLAQSLGPPPVCGRRARDGGPGANDRPAPSGLRVPRARQRDLTTTRLLINDPRASAPQPVQTSGRRRGNP